MADWFETRFRETVDAGQPDPAFVARMRALVVEEWQADAGATPSDFTHPDDREGDLIMLETEDRPTGQEPPSRDGSRGRWLLVAAVAALVAVVGTLLVLAGDDDPADQVPATTPPTTTPAPAQNIIGATSPLEPGTYFIDPDGDDTTPLRVTFEVTKEGWGPFLGPLKDFAGGGGGFTALHITTVPNLVTDGCLDHAPRDPAVGPTVGDLATALSQLAPFEVSQPVTDATLFGYQGKHLELTVPADMRMDPAAENYHDFADCVDGELHSWISTNNEGSFFGYDQPGISEELWILDVDGTRLVLVKMDSPDSPPEDIVERDAIFDTLRIEP